MKTSKLIFTHILTWTTIFLLLSRSLRWGKPAFSVSKEMFFLYIEPAVLILLLFTTLLLISLSYTVVSALARKNLLRVSLLLYLGQLIYLTVVFVRWALKGSLDYILLASSIILFVEFLLCISITKDLYKLLKKLFVQKEKHLDQKF
ncbi:hypothetical protein H6501_02910 [Candidatus Woesearchaeota archaeon]|nr:hypothetical protein [Nanoarchaeota archaeon]MCB9370522.1 hypothetical protein [Candidatus Woesearchaeota archaeon]USN43598.1 MAG: hypothetical protein H6500_04355 [Candidatus Woesearchaeota archaeon]